jgi:hypothetical protein
VPAVHAGHGDGNLHAHSRAAPCRLGCQYFHLSYSAGDLHCLNT